MSRAFLSRTINLLSLSSVIISLDYNFSQLLYRIETSIYEQVLDALIIKGAMPKPVEFPIPKCCFILLLSLTAFLGFSWTSNMLY